MKPLNGTLFSNESWTFQQDSSPAHRAESSQTCLRNSVPDFILVDDWPAGSPDLSPLDYKLWSVSESMACSTQHKNIEFIKRALVHAIANFSIEVVRSEIDAWPKKLCESNW